MVYESLNGDCAGKRTGDETAGSQACRVVWRVSCRLNFNARSQAATRMESMDHDHARTSVLIGDVFRICVAGLQKILEADFRVVGATCEARELVRLAGELRPEVIVTDILMQFSTADELARRVLAASPNSRVVVLTGHRDAWSAREGIRAGAAAYVLKDDPVQELIGTIRAVARGRCGIISPAFVEAGSDCETVGVLTPRQLQVLRLMAEGRSRKEIAAIVEISIRTVEFHKCELMRRLAVRSSAELVALAVRHRLLGAAPGAGI